MNRSRTRILLWASTLQADILALALHLDRCDDVELLIATTGLAAYLREPIATARPIAATILDMADRDTEPRVRAFAADVMLCDNHFPEFPAAARVVQHWHGPGWKARSPGDIKVNAEHIARLTGRSSQEPNPRFRAQCYHEIDRRWRIEASGMPAENCATVGACFTDLLGAPPYRREDLAPRYQIPILERPTLLVNFTWHYGRIFPGSWQPSLFGRSPMDADLAFVRDVCAAAADHGASILMALHDRRRYERPYLEALHREVARFPHVQLKHRDEHPDNLADLLVADAMVSNLSSFITFFYYFGRPTVHLCPPPGEKVNLTKMSGGKIRKREAGSEAWIFPPEDNGGLTAYNAAEALAAISRALKEPGCCREKSAEWWSRHVDTRAESSSARLANVLREVAAAR